MQLAAATMRSVVSERQTDLDWVPSPLLIVSDGRVAALNRAAQDLFRVSDAESVDGRRIDDLLVFEAEHGGPDKAGATSGWRGAVAHTFSGDRVPVLAKMTDRTAASGGVETIISLAPVSGADDIQSDLDAREASRDQIARLFANLAHEMRTPLNAVIGFGEIMAGRHFGPLDRKYADYAKDIVGAGYHLLGLVNGALDLGRASAGPDSLQQRPVELRAVLYSALALVEQAAAMKSISIGLPNPDSLPVVYADETRLRQVMVNLMSNAIKYSPRGRRVAISYSREREEEFRIDVRDDGIGMTADEIETAMLPFGRTESAMRAGEAGTGLGLPICRAIVEAHGGRLRIASSPNRGTTISVFLPSALLVAEPGVGGLLSNL